MGVYPSANIGVSTGRPSGVFVVDIDMKNGKNGEQELRALELKYGKLPTTVELITPLGGRHLWFRMPEHAVPSSVDKIAPGIDIRGDGGYVLVPPSHVVEDDGSGNYALGVDSGSEFADASEWLLELGVLPTAVGEIDARRPLEHWQRLTKGVPAGSRNCSAASLCGYLLRKDIHPETGPQPDVLVGFAPPAPTGAGILRTVELVLAKEIQRRGHRNA